MLSVPLPNISIPSEVEERKRGMPAFLNLEEMPQIVRLFLGEMGREESRNSHYHGTD